MLSSQSSKDSRLAKELHVATPVGNGKSKGARLVQELLRLHGINVVIDGDLGDATRAGLAKFCAKAGVPAATTVDQKLMDQLAQPLLRAAEPIAPKMQLGDTVVAVAKQHLKEHPVEIDGQNSGPWVRLYMDGNQGAAYPWCAGFVTYALRQAAQAHGQAAPFKRTYSCDVLAAEAKQSKRYKKKTSPAHVPAGTVFLVPRAGNPNDLVHTGLIVGGDGTVFNTIEGNTNDSGSREGFEVCARIRACAKVDVALL